MKVLLDPRMAYKASTYYIKGMRDYFGQKNVHYDVEPFLGIPYKSNYDFDSGFCAVFCLDGKDLKVFFDTQDVACIYEDRYAWCDVYAKVNPTEEQVQQLDKLIAIGTVFGITIDNKLVTATRCIYHYLKGKAHTAMPFSAYLKQYLYTNIRRRRISRYEQQVVVRPDYIFHASTLWYNDFAGAQTNRLRGGFLKAAQKAGLKIEGGLYYLGEQPYVLKEMPDYAKYKKEYKDFIFTDRLPMDDYIKKTKESLVVFNTPSVCECHGWKLGEYLCMGKAIISTPLTRELPAPLVHGENVHFVQSEEEIYDAIVKIRDDAEYRHQLERGAREYYEKYLAPRRVIERIVELSRQ